MLSLAAGNDDAPNDVKSGFIFRVETWDVFAYVIVFYLIAENWHWNTRAVVFFDG